MLVFVTGKPCANFIDWITLVSNDANNQFSFALFPREHSLIIRIDAWIHGGQKKQAQKSGKDFLQFCSFPFLRPAEIVGGVSLKNAPLSDKDTQDVLDQLQPLFNRYNIIITKVELVPQGTVIIRQMVCESIMARLHLK